MPELRVAILIPFTEWNPLVAHCVTACRALAYPSRLIVLLPDAGATVSVGMAGDPQVRVVLPGASAIAAKRNQGFKAVPDADYYALIDSDAYPQTDWLDQALRVFAAFERLGCVTGPNLSPGYPDLKRQAVANALMSGLVNGPRAFMRRPAAGSRFVKAGYSCNLVIARAAVEITGGFDETLASGEDTDFCRRLRHQGLRLYCSSAVRVYHHNRALYRPFIRQRLLAGHSVPALFRREPRLAALTFFLPLAFLLFLALGWVSVFIHRWVMWLWLAGVGGYLLAALVEAVRWSRRPAEIPLTWVAILIGGITPAFGTIAGFLGLRLQPGKFAANFSAAASDRAVT